MIRLRTRSPLLIAAVALALACPLAGAAQQASATGLDTAGMDRSVRPGDDFFSYANGAWLEHTEIPADRSSYGSSSILIELTDSRTADLIRAVASLNAPAGSEPRKIGDYYASFMDSTAIDAAGLTPLKARLDSIAAIEGRHAGLQAVRGERLVSAVRREYGVCVDK